MARFLCLLSTPYQGGQKGGVKRGPGFTILGTTETSAFLTNALSRFAIVIVECLLGPPCQARHKLDRWIKIQYNAVAWLNRWCPCFSVVPEATHEGRSKDTISAQKARVRDCLRDLLAGTEEDIVSTSRGH